MIAIRNVVMHKFLCAQRVNFVAARVFTRSQAPRLPWAQKNPVRGVNLAPDLMV